MNRYIIVKDKKVLREADATSATDAHQLLRTDNPSGELLYLRVGMQHVPEDKGKVQTDAN